jgi:hypothetical protein
MAAFAASGRQQWVALVSSVWIVEWRVHNAQRTLTRERRQCEFEPTFATIRRSSLEGQDQPFTADSSLASRPDAEAQARRAARSNAVV